MLLERGSDVPYPLLFVRFDEEFFWKPENAVTGSAWHEAVPDPSEIVRQHFGFHGTWKIISDLVMPPAVYANNPNGHESCYHYNKLDLWSIKIYNDWEPALLEPPEIFTQTRLVYRFVPGNPTSPGSWPKDNVFFNNQVVEEDYLYDSNDESWLPKHIFGHGTDTCNWDSEWDYNSVKDHAHIGVKEYDGGWSGNDKLAKWKDVPTESPCIISLNANSKYAYTGNNWNEDAIISIGLEECVG